MSAPVIFLPSRRLARILAGAASLPWMVARNTALRGEAGLPRRQATIGRPATLRPITRVSTTAPARTTVMPATGDTPREAGPPGASAEGGAARAGRGNKRGENRR